MIDEEIYSNVELKFFLSAKENKQFQKFFSFSLFEVSEKFFLKISWRSIIKVVCCFDASV